MKNLLAVGLCIGAVIFAFWLFTLLPGAASDMASEERAAAPKKAVKNPVPEWATEHQHVYLAAMVGFRVEREKLSRWALKLSQLECKNTQFCAYAVDECEPWEITYKTDDSIELTSLSEGIDFRAVGPWDLLMRDRASCKKATAGRSRFYSIPVVSHIDRMSLARPK